MNAEDRISLLITLMRGSQSPMSALRLAQLAGIPGHSESMRRAVRKLVEIARAEYGHRICADGDGYWLARSDSEWHEYKEACKTEARFKFVRLRNMAEAASDRASGQGTLIDLRPTAAERMPT